MKPIEELRAAHAATTPGEWDFVVASGTEPPSSAVVGSAGQCLLRHCWGVAKRAQNEVAFIALAHNEFPAMLDEIEALRHQLR